MTNTKALNKVLSWTGIICSVTIFALLYFARFDSEMFGPGKDATVDINWDYSAIILLLEIVALAAILWKIIFCTIPNMRDLGAEPYAVAGLIIDIVFASCIILAILVLPLMGATKVTAEGRQNILEMIGSFASPLAMITSIAGLKLGKKAYGK